MLQAMFVELSVRRPLFVRRDRAERNAFGRNSASILDFFSTEASHSWCKPAIHLPKFPTGSVTASVAVTEKPSWISKRMRKKSGPCSMWSSSEDDVNSRNLKFFK